MPKLDFAIFCDRHESKRDPKSEGQEVNLYGIRPGLILDHNVHKDIELAMCVSISEAPPGETFDFAVVQVDLQGTPVGGCKNDITFEANGGLLFVVTVPVKDPDPPYCQFHLLLGGGDLGAIRLPVVRVSAWEME